MALCNCNSAHQPCPPPNSNSASSLAAVLALHQKQLFDGEVQGMETTQVIEITSAPGPAAAPTRAAAAVAPSGACPLPPDPPSLPPTARQPCRQYP